VINWPEPEASTFNRTFLSSSVNRAAFDAMYAAMDPADCLQPRPEAPFKFPEVEVDPTTTVGEYDRHSGTSLQAMLARAIYCAGKNARTDADRGIVNGIRELDPGLERYRAYLRYCKRPFVAQLLRDIEYAYAVASEDEDITLRPLAA